MSVGVESKSAVSPVRAGSRGTKGRRLAFVGLLAIAAGGGYYWYRSAREVEGDKPLVVTAVIGDVENAVASSGTLQPSNTVPVGAQVSGQLQKLHVQVGDQVDVGQLLGEIDARVQQLLAGLGSAGDARQQDRAGRQDRGC